MWHKFSILAQPFQHFLSHYKESADAKEKEEALTLGCLISNSSSPYAKYFWIIFSVARFYQDPYDFQAEVLRE